MSLLAMSRRHFFGTAAGIAAAVTAPPAVVAQAPTPALQPAPTGPFMVPSLTYAIDAFEPHIDAKTMEIHHDKHHGAYVAALNNFAKDHPQIAEKSVVEVLGNLGAVPEAIRTGVRNNLGGHANHTMFWGIMGPNGGKPQGEVLAAIDRDLGGLEKFQTDFNAAGGRQFGSGWVFVTVTKDGRLAIETRPNQDTPLMDGKLALFGNDVWEHAYYLSYQNRRPDYLKAWWNTVNWDKIAQRYAAAKAGTLGV
jgi:superoxide dismutase, Fe-Mn family